MLFGLNLAFGLAMLASAILSYLNPAEHSALVIAGMAFPGLLCVCLLLFFVDFFLLRKGCVFLAIMMAPCLSLALTVLPLNIPHGKVPERLHDREWTLLTYNIAQFYDRTDQYPDGTNPSLRYVLDTDADVVVLEEARWLYPLSNLRISQELIDSIYERYPYHFRGMDITFLSKFPADTVSLSNFPKQLYGSSFHNSKAALLTVDIKGEKVAIFGVHLKSLGLTSDDKQVYADFTKGEGFTSRRDIEEAKNDIIAKIAAANKARAIHIEALMQAVDSIGYANSIICGDFNDTPGCYSLRLLEDNGFREVYPLLGNGYMHTFNSSRLYFQIDHVLFRGNLRPWSIKRGNLKSSDHYPLLTTFINNRIDGQKN